MTPDPLEAALAKWEPPPREVVSVLLAGTSDIRWAITQAEEVTWANDTARQVLRALAPLLARVAELEREHADMLGTIRRNTATLGRVVDERDTARQQLAVAQERITALEGAIRLIRDQARPVMVGDAYLSATAEVPVAAVEAAASLLPDQPGREG